jgi:beta-phosphoglucomutase-like phosphatase (HAD superfamily)
MRIALTREQYDAILFDLDGVITDTANMHAACWKQMFDAYLQQRAVERRTTPSISPRTTGSMWMEAPIRRRSRLSHITWYPTSRGKRRRPRAG